jgi:hypothetical protein
MALQAMPTRPAQRPAASFQKKPLLGPTARIVVVATGLTAALEVGALFADRLQADTPWLTVLCLCSPVAVAAGLFWLIGRLI